VATFFAGAGGLDLGFKLAGFSVPWANEYDKNIWATYESNFKQTKLDRRSIVEVQPSDIPDVQGFIGGPPCQSWSEAGSLRGIEDQRGQLFYEYLRLIKANRPGFFLAENVSGILFERHGNAFKDILKKFTDIGYNVSFGLLRASNYGIPQDRDRVIIVGYRTDSRIFFTPPSPLKKRSSLREAIGDLPKNPPGRANSDDINSKISVLNHEYMTGGFSPMYMSRNRVRGWDEASFTIQAGARHAPIHPSAPKMLKEEKDKFIFSPGSESKYRRLSVRECARIQTFPDNHEFIYNRIADGYKMIGNAVPVQFAKVLAKRIHDDLSGMEFSRATKIKPGSVCTFEELAQEVQSA